jgi:hypothetical protein
MDAPKECCICYLQDSENVACLALHLQVGLVFGKSWIFLAAMDEAWPHSSVHLLLWIIKIGKYVSIYFLYHFHFGLSCLLRLILQLIKCCNGKA